MCPRRDPLLDHPRGLLDRSKHAVHCARADADDGDSDGDAPPVPSTYIAARTEAEAAAVEAQEDDAFARWIDAIYSKYRREDMNHFEHNVQVPYCAVCVCVHADVCVRL